MAHSSSRSRSRSHFRASPGLRHAGFALVLAAMCGAVQADTFRVGIFANGDRPFSFAQGSPQPGIYPDLMRAIARESGDKIELVYVPAARLLRMFEIGELDIEVGSNPAWRKSSPIRSVYSASYATAYEILCFLPGEAKPGNAARDFPGYDIGVQAGYYYPNFEKAFADGSVKRRDTNNAEQLLKMLNAKRFQAIIISKYAADFYKKVNPAQYACEQGAITDQAMEMLRLPATKADALPRLNAAIARLKKSGEIEAIYAKYR
jgi:ABC-type amino acid transport substrate-binding protein